VSAGPPSRTPVRYDAAVGARESLSLAQARRIALAAQGFADARPQGRIDRRHFRRVLRRVGLVQIDSVNVLARAHELAFLARLGPYPRAELGRWLWGSGEVFEYWGHEASVMPAALHPLLRWRMERGDAWGGMKRIAAERPDLVETVRGAVHDQGPVPLSRIEGIADAHRSRTDSMWGWSDAKRAVEWLFWIGEVTAIRDPATFTRSYLAPRRLLPAEVMERPAPGREEARRQLLMIAARCHGVGTARDLADYFRLHTPRCRSTLEALADEGLLRRVSVEGWRQPAYLHPEASLPRRVPASALLSPFDSLVWERARTERLFGMRYRVEIYVPAANRVHGYYVLPLLQQEQLTGRVDLKADRQAGVLRVQAAHREPWADEDEVAAGMVGRLWEMAAFLGLGDVAVEGRGDLSGALRRRLA
jgi:uncharacterized protein